MSVPLWDIPPRRGHVVLVELDPAVDPEQNKTRPCIIVSNDGANAAAARTGNTMLTVVPLTRTLNTTGRDRPYQTVILPEESGLSVQSTAQAEQVRSVSVRRVVRVIGHLNFEAMARVDEALKVHLALNA
ncbi:MAG: type II toxin-antitoxin system PemK/MazF family toxin [Propionibacteriaceae bacterium]|jgi:mRNA interferase MazF|nr:type II toxin-antitoxin system PemK/MazF family toxin [Propionibacteriaceae bacterium]